MNKKLIHTVFEHVAAQVPAHMAVEEENGHISYQELNSRANQLAHALQAAGVTTDSVVGTFIPSSIPLIISILAIFKSGGIYLPFDLAFARKRLLQMFANSMPEVVVTTADAWEDVQTLLKEAGATTQTCIVFEASAGFRVFTATEDAGFLPMGTSDVFATENLPLTSSPDDGNYLFYTSGSTGEAKAFLGCHKSLSHFIHWELKEFGITATCRVSQLAQITFDASLRDIFVPLAVGATLCIPSRDTKTNTVRLAEWIEQSGINLIHCVPSLFRLLSTELKNQARTQAFPELRYILMAGETLYAKDITNWRTVAGTHVELVNLYGTSETTLAKTFHRISEVPAEPNHLIHVGRPIDNAAVLILNDGIPCLPGETGEIFIRTPFMTKGYYQNPAQTQQVFIQNPLMSQVDIIHKTGDKGRFTKELNIEVLSRTDDQVKVNGVRVEPGEIKQAVLRISGINEVVVMAQENADHENELICYFTGSPVDAEDLRDQLKTELNEYMIPAYFIHLDAFPLTPNGKVDKKELPRPQVIIQQNKGYEEPQGELEQQLAAYWQEILSLDTISRKAEFFKLGGTSLKAIQLISRIYKRYNTLIKMNEIFAHPSIAQLAALIESRTKVSYEEITPVPLQEHYDVTHSQKRLWIMDQLESEQAAYNIPAAYLFKGSLHLEAFRKAFQALIERHESLRTTFVSVQGQPKQRIHAATHTGFELVIRDISGESAPYEKAQKIVNEEAFRPFDLVHGPLLRAGLLQVAADEYVFLFVMHHINSDGSSFEVMVKDLRELYQAFASGKENPLSPLRIQYKDYTAWINKKLSGENLKIQQKYWVSQFEDELPVLHLPTDYPRFESKTTNGAIIEFEIGSSLTKNLQQLSKDAGVSMFMTMLSLVNMLLYRHTGQEDMVVGTPVAGRNHKDLESQIGLYVNLLPLRTRLHVEENFEKLLKDVKAVTLGAYEHALYPFDLLIKDLNIDYNSQRSPLADVWVQMSDAPWVRLSGDDHKMFGEENLTVRPFPFPYTISKVDLTFKFTSLDHTIHTIIEYNTDLFDERTIENLKNELMAIGEKVTAERNLSLRQLRKEFLPDTLQNQSLVTSDISEDF